MGEPVITNALYPNLALLNGKFFFKKIFFIRLKNLGVSKEERSRAVRDLVHKMPEENFLLLKTIILFLTEVFI